MSGKTVYLISGSNRGIGYTLTASLAARPNMIVFAGAHDPAAQSLKDLVAKHPNVHPIKLISGDEADNTAAAAEIQKTAGYLDIVITNTGITKYCGALATTPLSEFTDHWQVNTFATIVLYQAVHKLLLASPTGAPKFTYISTIAASIGAFLNFSGSAYGSSKAAVNYLVKVLDAENPSLVTLAISPGWVATDMGNTGAVAHGLPQAPVSMEDSMARILARVDAMTKEMSGRFWNYSSKTGGKPLEVGSDKIAW
ncbi:hypothetical protein B0H14DRAFT_3773246 [Mycena olivaceomarginata]|nr:hypothetical protein B0H14DRAFT_3773246 [Mycena olivaceomarginata]